MKKLLLYAVTIVNIFCFLGIADAGPLVIGDPPNDQNCFEFGCEFRTSSRYQQVYSSAAFPGPILIREIEFYQAITGDLNIGSFEFYLSTTSLPVNGLDTLDFDSNLGADNSLFAVVSFNGAHSFARVCFRSVVIRFSTIPNWAICCWTSSSRGERPVRPQTVSRQRFMTAHFSTQTRPAFSVARTTSGNTLKTSAL